MTNTHTHTHTHTDTDELFFPWFSKLSISLVIIPRAQSRKQSYKLNTILLTCSHTQDWPADPVGKTTDFDSVDLECGLRFAISNKLPGDGSASEPWTTHSEWPGCKQHCAWIQVTCIFCFSISLSLLRSSRNHLLSEKHTPTPQSHSAFLHWLL